MGQIKNTIQNQIDMSSLQTYQPTSGVILEYDQFYNTAKVKYRDTFGDGYIIRESVPIALTNGGISTPIKKGQRCSIVFTGGNKFSPTITGITTSTFQDREYADQAGFLIDENIRENVEKPATIIPMVSNWVDEQNTNPTKYINRLSGYNNIDVESFIFDTMLALSHCTKTEQGMNHLDTHSGLRLKDNGDFEVFVADNVGMRLSKDMRKIYFYGFDINVNGEVNILEELRKIKPFEVDLSPYMTIEDFNLINAVNRLIDFIDHILEELKEALFQAENMTGDEEAFARLYKKIEEYEKERKNYLTTDIVLAELPDFKNKLIQYRDEFEEELNTAKNILQV